MPERKKKVQGCRAEYLGEKRKSCVEEDGVMGFNLGASILYFRGNMVIFLHPKYTQI